VIAIDKRAPNWLALEINNRLFVQAQGLLHGHVIDLGCGNGPFRDDMLALGLRYTGVDWPGSAHRTGQVDVYADLGRPLPFRDGSCDSITLFQVLEHVPSPWQLLPECRRLLCPGGAIVITVPFMWHVHEAPYDFYRYTRYGLTHLLLQAGFTEIEVTESTGFWQMAVLKFNYWLAAHLPRRTHRLAVPLWWLGQTVAPMLDRWRPHPTETASYLVTARAAGG
jgi:SAM-dependent methyltransferase